MIYLGCSCECPHTTEQRFYVTAVNGDRVAYLAGPFLSHQKAIDLVDMARTVAQDIDPWAAFYAFGTVALCRSDAERIVGVLNDKLGVLK